MKPHETGKRYDAIATWWDSQQPMMTAGLRYVERAIGLSAVRGKALDVGCGSGGRIHSALTDAGFTVVGLDVSESMLVLAKARHPTASFVLADICTWEPPDKYDLIVAWDSTFHVPHTFQRRVTAKLCRALAPEGVILFTAGSINGEITGEMSGETFYYSSLADAEYLQILKASGCTVLLMERDQYPEQHLVVIGIRENA